MLPFSDQSSADVGILQQGVEMGVIRVPLHLISLHSDIVSGTVTVGLRVSLPVKGISMILGNDLTGDRVKGDPQVSDVPCLATENEAIEDLFSSCVVTCAIAKLLRHHKRIAHKKNLPISLDSNSCQL